MLDTRKIRRVLIYRLGSLGDTVVALPALHLVARTFPQAKRLLLTNAPVHRNAPAASAILNDSGLVGEYITYPFGTRSFRELARVWWQILKFRPQLLVYLTAPRGDSALKRDIFFFKMCGISRMVGMPVGELAKPRYLPESRIWEHESLRLLRTIRQIADGPADDEQNWDKQNWDLHLNQAEEQVARNALAAVAGKPLVVCGPATKMQAKDWGKENWRELLSKLKALLPEHALALVGAEEDRSICNYVAGGWQGAVVNLCGKLTPRETAAAIRGAELFLGPDSGPMHLAAAVGVPCACVFAARAMPGTWYPVGPANRIIYHRVNCMGCQLETCIEQKKKCLTSVTVDELLTSALEAWRYGRKQAST